MTKAQEIYVATLNLLGSDPEPDYIQVLLDEEHAAADPGYRKRQIRQNATEQLNP